MTPWLRLLLLAWLALAAAWGHADQARRLDRAEFLLSPSALPPPDAAAWRPQALPDAWRVNHPDAARAGPATGWYRLAFEAHTREPLQAVYLPRLGLNAAVWLNGRPLGDGGPFDEPVGRNWNRPLLFLIPDGLLRDGANTLHVRLFSHPYTQASLDPPWIGPERLLRPRFDRAHFFRVTLNQTASLLIASIGVLMLVLWWQRRQDVAYGYFGISALVWAAQSANLYLRAAPLPTAAWEVLVNGSFQVFSAFLLVSLLRFATAGGRPLIPLLWFSAIASPLSLALVPGHLFLAATSFWHVYTLLCSIATLAFLLRAAVGWHNRDATLLAGAMGLVVLLAAHDWFMHSQHFWRSPTDRFLEDVYLLHYSAPLVFLVVGLIMASRFVRVLNEFEALNDELETRVQAKHAELQDSYGRMRAMEMEQAVTEERERIYRDLHDDVGAKLLSLVYRAGTPETAELARSALQDLRDVVSTTQQDKLSLSAACADWRVECEQRLSAAGIGLDWQTRGDLESIELHPAQTLNLGRILREAVSNLIKHARAVRAEVCVEAVAGGLRLRVRDDGRGCNGGAEGGNGRGLRNMESRAARIGATFTRRDAAAGGCEIEVGLPLS
ncbi:MAG: ATP-binding protein [Pseudomonadota bacterium]